MNIKEIIKSVFRMICILVISTIVGTAMLILTFSFSVDRIRNNVKKSINMLKQETDYFMIAKGSQLDNFTEAVYLNMSLVSNSDKGFFTSLFGDFFAKPAKEFTYPIENLEYVLNHDDVKLNGWCAKWWNGYLIFTKLLLLVTDYAGIRLLNFYLQSFLIISILFFMHKKKMSVYEIPLLIIYLFINPLTTSLCMTFAGFFYCTFIPILIMLSKNESLSQRKYYNYFFEIIGIAAAFFNENYFQLISFGFPVVFYFLINGFPFSIKKMIKITFVFFFFWFMGYAGMLLSKWIVLYICTGKNIFGAVLHNMLFRFSTNTGMKEFSRFDAVKINFYSTLNIFNYLIELAFLIWSVYSISKKKKNIKAIISGGCFILLLFTLVIARYLIFANHVYIHHWVTYRLFFIPLFAFNVLLTVLSDDNRKVYIKEECY